MNNSLSIDTRKTIELGKQVTDKGNRFSKLLEEINSLNEELKISWEGSDASKYSKASEEQTNQMRSLSKTLVETGIFLEVVGGKYSRAREENISGVMTPLDNQFKGEN